MNIALSILKSEVKGNSTKAKTLRKEADRALHNGRFFAVIGEAEGSKEQKEDSEKSEAYYNLYQNLRHRRTHELRRKQRHLFLAYAFLRGFEYVEIETVKYSNPDFNEVERIIFTFLDSEKNDPRDVKQTFERWVQEAKKVD